MDSRQVEELLRKYWDCETTLEEEQQLRTYFNGNQIPESLKDAASLFQYFENQKLKKVSGLGFEDQVVSQLKRTALHDGGKIRRMVYATMRIAAGVAVLLAAIYVVRLEIRKEDPVAMDDTYETPEQAFEETKKALMMISRGFGRAEQQVKKINVFNEAQEKIKEGPVKEEQNL
jgi:hypothetical protein